jgi:predicted nucleic-acid-binding protein
MTVKRDGWLDTNVILRFLIRDNESLFEKARKLFTEAEQGNLRLFLHPLVVAELVWTLDSFYGYTKKEIITVVGALIEADGIYLQELDIVRNALYLYEEKNVDYIDAYLAAYAISNKPDAVYSFDKKHFGKLPAHVIFPA